MNYGNRGNLFLKSAPPLLLYYFQKSGAIM